MTSRSLATAAFVTLVPLPFVLVAIPGKAQAQTADGPVPRNQKSGGASPASVRGRQETLGTTAPTVTSITGGDLKNAGAGSLSDIANLMISTAGAETTGARLDIRGVTGDGDGVRDLSTTALLVNGQRQAGSAFLPNLTFDTDHVEVLKGPASALVGRDALGGVVGLFTARPGRATTIGANVERGGFDALLSDFAINAPVSKDLAVRVAAAASRRSAYRSTDAVSREGKPSDQTDRAARFSADWRFGPGRAGSMQLTADVWSKHGPGTERRGVTGILGPTGDATHLSEARLNAALSDPLAIASQRQDDSGGGVQALLSYDLGGSVFRYAGTYRTLNRWVRQAFSSRFGAFDEVERGELRFVTQSARIERGDALRLTLSADHSRLWSRGLTAARRDPAGQRQTHYTLLSDQSLSASLQALWKASSKLDVQSDLRWTRDSFRLRGATSSSTIGVAPTAFDIDRSRPTPSWRLGVDYKLAATTTGYFSTASGYSLERSRGRCFTAPAACVRDGDPALFGRRRAMNYEAGVRSRPLRFLNLGANLFLHDDGRTTVPNADAVTAGLPTPRILPAVRAGGIEVESGLQLDENDRARVMLGWVTSRTETSEAPGGAIRRYDVSSLTGFVGYTHVFRVASGGTVAAHVESRLSTSAPMVDAYTGAFYRQGGYVQSSARIAYNPPGDHWYAQLFVRNIENQLYATSVYSGAAALSAPRSAFLRLGLRL